MASKLRQYLGNTPIKLIAVIFFAIFVPSVLVTALGLVAVFQAQSYVSERFTHPVRQKVEELGTRLRSEWNERLQRHGRWLADAPRRVEHLGDLRVRDPWIEDVHVSSKTGTAPAPDPPPRRLPPSPSEAELKELRRLELLTKDFPAALEECHRLLAAAVDETVTCEALLAAARLSYKLGDRERSLHHLRSALAQFGNTIDASGMVLALPILLRMLEIEREHSPAAASGAAGPAAELAGWIERTAPHVPEDTVTYFSRRLASLGGRMPNPGESAAGQRMRRTQALSRHLPAWSSLGVGQWRETHVDVAGEGERDIVSFRIGGGELVVHLQLSRSRYLEEAAAVCEEVGLPASGLAFQSGARGAPAAHSVTRELPPPFSNLRFAYTPVGSMAPAGFRGFGVLSLATFTWAVIVLVLTILIGVLFTVRSVLRALRTARLKSDFVSFITHELKTPLTAIRTLTETMLTGRISDEEENRLCIQMISTETERLSKLVGQVLEYSQIERRQKEFRFSSCDMEDVVHDAVRIFHDHNRANPRSIEVNSAQHISKIKLDREAMIELLLNLLSNAAKYSSPEKKIIINLRETIAEICVEVVDRGIGIRKRDQKRIFEKFFRAEDYLTREVEGTGLGLTFARYIAKVHNGDIRVSSQVANGSTFSLHLRKTHILAE